VIEIDRLIAHALGDLDAADAELVDEHVLACGACATIFERLLSIGDGVRALVGAGAVPFVATRGFVAALERAKLISRSYAIAPGQIVPCTVGAADIYSATTLHGDLRGVVRLDLERRAGPSTERVEDVPFDPESGQITLITSSAFLRTLPSTRVSIRLFGDDRLVGDYLLDHTAMATG
jgi:hypothetical protein